MAITRVFVYMLSLLFLILIGVSETRICENNVAKYSNGTVYGKFNCPTRNQSDYMHACCGPKGEQRCCGFWDDPGRIIQGVIGIVIGVLACIGFIICMVKFYYIKKKKASCSNSGGGCKFRNKTKDSAKAQLPPGEEREQSHSEGFKESNYKADYSSPEAGPQPPSYDQVTTY